MLGSKYLELSHDLDRDVDSFKQAVFHHAFRRIDRDYGLPEIQYYESLGKIANEYLKRAKYHEDHREYDQAVLFYRKNFHLVGCHTAAKKLGLNIHKNQPLRESRNIPINFDKMTYEHALTQGYRFLGGIGQTVNAAMAYQCFLHAEKLKPEDPEACDMLSYCNYYAIGTAYNLDEALKQNKMSLKKEFATDVATSQYAPALFRCYQYASKGYGNKAEKSQWLLLSAKANYAQAIHELGILSQESKEDDPLIVNKQPADVAEIYQRACALGYEASYYSLGVNALGEYTEGDFHLKNPDIPSAINFLEKALRSGSYDARCKASLELGWLYSGFYHSEVAVDYKRALAYFNSVPDSPLGLLYAAKIYLDEDFKEYNKDKGIALIREAVAISRQTIHNFFIRTVNSYVKQSPDTPIEEIKKEIIDKYFSISNVTNVFQDVVEARTYIFDAYELCDMPEFKYHYAISIRHEALIYQLAADNPNLITDLLLEDNDLDPAEKLTYALGIEKRYQGLMSPSTRDKLEMAIGNSYFLMPVDDDIENIVANQRKAEKRFINIASDSEFYGEAQSNLFLIYQSFAQQAKWQNNISEFTNMGKKSNSAQLAAREAQDNDVGRHSRSYLELGVSFILMKYFPANEPGFFKSPEHTIYLDITKFMEACDKESCQKHEALMRLIASFATTYPSLEAKLNKLSSELEEHFQQKQALCFDIPPSYSFLDATRAFVGSVVKRLTHCTTPEPVIEIESSLLSH